MKLRNRSYHSSFRTILIAFLLVCIINVSVALGTEDILELSALTKHSSCDLLCEYDKLSENLEDLT